MKRYVVTLDERAELSEIKGSHLSQKVINALLNCDEGAFNECPTSSLKCNTRPSSQ